MKFAVTLVLAFTAAAQEPRFGVQSRLVLVPVTVTDAKGQSIDSLETKNFVLLDNGRPQQATVDTMATGVAPIALIIAIQASGLSRPVLEKVQKIGSMIQPLVTGDRGCAGVVTFSDRVDWLQECTNDAGALTRAIELVRPGAGKKARLLDAAFGSIKALEKQPNSRRVLLLISESRDRSSETALEQVATAAEAAAVTVYAATYSVFTTAFTSNSAPEPQAPKVPKTPSEQTGTIDGGPPHCGPLGCPNPPLPTSEQRVDLLAGIGELVRLGKTNDTAVLTDATGGATFPFTRRKGLEEAIEKLGSELHSQYLLSFTPDDFTAGYHRLEVRVSRDDVRVRARPGYWSFASAR